MATSKDFHDYVMENLLKIGDFSSRKMMGEYCIYYRGKKIGDLCDNTFLLTPAKSVLDMMPEAQRQYPYEGSKTLMVVVEDIENIDFLAEVINAMYGELPNKKK